MTMLNISILKWKLFVDILTTVVPNSVMVVADLQDAYLVVPISK